METKDKNEEHSVWNEELMVCVCVSERDSILELVFCPEIVEFENLISKS